jgi:predicted Zn-dependent protease
MTNKWYHPKESDTGWDKDLAPDTRRALMLKAQGGDNLAAGRALQSLANVTRDKATAAEASRDARYFFRLHRKGREMIEITRGTPRISIKAPRISCHAPRIL